MDLAKREADLEAQHAELQKLRKLRERFPDLTEVTNRWKRVRLSSEQVNAIADQVEITHACGCCNDSELHAYPYIEIDGTKIFSKPDHVAIGEKMWTMDHASKSWRQRLRSARISEVVIAAVAAYFSKQRLERIADLEEEIAELRAKEAAETAEG